MRLKPSTATKIARPGKRGTHQEVRRYKRPLATILPHSGLGGWAPKPIKLKLEARRIA
jgi:hypothetical protein